MFCKRANIWHDMFQNDILLQFVNHVLTDCNNMLEITEIKSTKPHHNTSIAHTKHL